MSRTWLALILALVAACDRTSPDPAVLRFIEDDPPALFDPGLITDSIRMLDWSFEGDRARSRLETLRFASGRGTPRVGGLYLEADGEEIVLELPGPIDTGTVDTLVVTLAGVQDTRLALQWRTVPEGKVHRSQRRIPPGRLAAGGEYALDLRAHPAWTGEALEPRLAITDATPSNVLVLRSIVGERRELRQEKLEAAVARPWKVDLGEVRSALLAPPGLRIARRLRIPEGRPTLDFAYGMTAASDRPATFRVRAERPGSGAGEVLWEDTRRRARWRVASVDLARFARSELTLVLETAAGGELDPLAGLPAWGHPEVARTVPGARPNVVVISIDTLRADHLPLYGYPRPITPALDAWARRHGVVFENAVASAPWTLPSTLSMLTGVDAVGHGVNQLFGTPPAHATLLAEYLRAAGYWTAAITGAGYLHPKFGFHRAHEVYHYARGRAPDELERGVALAGEWLAEMREPFYLFFHTYSVHAPYLARQPYYDRLTGGRADPGRADTGRADTGRRVVPDHRGGFLDLENRRARVSAAAARDLYDSGIAHMDAQMGRLFRRIEELGLRGRTIVVFTSDHGEALGEGGQSGHGLMQDHNLLVPLILELPDGAGAGATTSRQVRSVDVVPTVLEAAGLAPASGLDGVSLLPLVRAGAGAGVPEVAVSYASAHGLSLRVGGRFKYLFENAAWAQAHGRERLYVLDGDPGERLDVAADHPGRVAELRARARRLAARLPGVWMRFSNAGTGALSGSLRGVGLTRRTVKSPDLACRCVRLVGDGHLRFEVPPGAAYHLILESTDLGELALQARLRAPPRPSVIRRRVDLRDRRGPISFQYSDAAWQRVEKMPAAGETGISLWRQGSPPSPGGRPQADPKVREQLRALGYLD